MVGALWCGKNLDSNPSSDTYQLYDALDESLNVNKLHFLHLFQKTALIIYQRMVFRVRNHDCKAPSTVLGK